LKFSRLFVIIIYSLVVSLDVDLNRFVPTPRRCSSFFFNSTFSLLMTL